MQQLTLFDEHGRYARWRDFHRHNPAVYDMFRQFAAEARKRERRKRFGARMIWERLRWYTEIETTSTDYKLNDHYAPYYARLLMIQSPEDFGDFFEIRESRSDVTLDEMRQDFGVYF